MGSPNTISPSPSPSRLWKPAAQRNVRNQWSKLLSSKERWLSAASQGTSQGTDFVNAYLNRRNLPAMDLGVLKNMQHIREKSSDKLAQMQELCCSKFLSCYKDMVDAVTILVKASGSMRCYLKVSGSSSIIQYCNHQENPNDFGDGGGIPVFPCLSISILDGGKGDVLSWSDELYPGEFDNLRSNGMITKDSGHPITPQIMDWPPSDPISRTPTKFGNQENFQVNFCGWINHVNIKMRRTSPSMRSLTAAYYEITDGSLLGIARLYWCKREMTGNMAASPMDLLSCCWPSLHLPYRHLHCNPEPVGSQRGE